MTLRSFGYLAAVLGLAVLALMTTGCGAVKGSGKRALKTLPAAAPFTAVRGEGAIELALRHGTGAEITVDADDNLHDLVRTEISDGVLRIWTTRGWTSENPLRVTVRA